MASIIPCNRNITVTVSGGAASHEALDVAAEAPWVPVASRCGAPGAAAAPVQALQGQAEEAEEGCRMAGWGGDGRPWDGAQALWMGGEGKGEEW